MGCDENMAGTSALLTEKPTQPSDSRRLKLKKDTIVSVCNHSMNL